MFKKNCVKNVFLLSSDQGQEIGHGKGRKQGHHLFVRRVRRVEDWRIPTEPIGNKVDPLRGSVGIMVKARVVRDDLESIKNRPHRGPARSLEGIPGNKQHPSFQFYSKNWYS